MRFFDPFKSEVLEFFHPYAKSDKKSKFTEVYCLTWLNTCFDVDSTIQKGVTFRASKTETMGKYGDAARNHGHDKAVQDV